MVKLNRVHPGDGVAVRVRAHNEAMLKLEVYIKELEQKLSKRDEEVSAAFLQQESSIGKIMSLLDELAQRVSDLEQENSGSIL